MKPGHPLREIASFPKNLLAKLRDELSVTTAEEFVGMWRVAPEYLGRAVGDQHEAELLAEEAMKIIPPATLAKAIEAEQSHYPFATGHEPPPDGQKTY